MYTVFFEMILKKEILENDSKELPQFMASVKANEDLGKMDRMDCSCGDCTVMLRGTKAMRPKHPETTGGKGAQFIGKSKNEAENLLKEVMVEGKVISVVNNGITRIGNKSYE